MEEAAIKVTNEDSSNIQDIVTVIQIVESLKFRYNAFCK